MNEVVAALFLLLFAIFQARLFLDLQQLPTEREPWRVDLFRRLIFVDTCGTGVGCDFTGQNAVVLDTYTVPDGVELVLLIASDDGTDMNGDWPLGCSDLFRGDMSHLWRVVVMHSKSNFVGGDSNLVKMIQRCISPSRISFVQSNINLNDSTVGYVIHTALRQQFPKMHERGYDKLRAMFFIRPQYCTLHTKHPHWLDIITKRFLRTLPDPTPPYWIDSATSRPFQMPISMQNILPRNLPLLIMSCAWFRPSIRLMSMLEQVLRPGKWAPDTDFSLQFHLLRSSNYTLLRSTAHHFASSNLICHAEAEEYLDKDICVMFSSWKPQ